MAAEFYELRQKLGDALFDTLHGDRARKALWKAVKDGTLPVAATTPAERWAIAFLNSERTETPALPRPGRNAIEQAIAHLPKPMAEAIRKHYFASGLFHPSFNETTRIGIHPRDRAWLFSPSGERSLVDSSARAIAVPPGHAVFLEMESGACTINYNENK